MTHRFELMDLRSCKCGHFHATPGSLVTERCPDCRLPPCLHFVPADGRPLDFEPVREAA